MKRFLRNSVVAAAAVVSTSSLALAQTTLTAPTIDTTGMAGVGTAILAALAVVASLSLMIKMIRKA